MKVTFKTGLSKFVKKGETYYLLSNETKPLSGDGVVDGDNLFIIDTQQTFIYYQGVWREI
jgi:hypothetical protein